MNPTDLQRGLDAHTLTLLRGVEGEVCFATNAADADALDAPWPAGIEPEDQPALRDAWHRARCLAEPFERSARFRESGGGRRYRLRAVPIRDDEGALLAWIGTRTAEPEVVAGAGDARDVTSLRAIESMVQRERDRFEAMTSVVPGAFLSFRGTGHGPLEILYASSSTLALFGFPPERFIEDPRLVRYLTHPEDRARMEGEILRSARDLCSLRCEFRVAHPIRGEIWVEAFAAPAREADGSLVWHGFFVDASERKRVERELREQRDRLTGLTASTPGALYTMRMAPDGALTFTYASPSTNRVYGVTPEALLGDFQQVFAPVHPEDLGRLQASIAGASDGTSPWRCEFRIAHPERGETWIEAQSTPRREADGAIAWDGVVIDVTERKRADAELRAERDRFAAIAETAPGAIFTFCRRADGALDVPYVSPSIADVFGLTFEELRAHPDRVYQSLHPDDLPRLAKSAAEAVASLSNWRAELRVAHPKKGEVWIELHARPTREPDGGLTWHGILIDISDRRRDDAKLRTSEATLRAVVETVPDFLLLVGRDGKIRYINPLLPGLTMESVVGVDAMNFVAPSMRAEVVQTMERVFSTKTMQVYSAVAPDPQGDPRWYETRIGPVLSDGEVIAVTIAATDITDRRRAEEKVRTSEASLRSILETAPNVMMSIGRNGKIRFINRVMPHHSYESVIGSDALSHLSPESRPVAEAAIARVFTTGKLETYEAALGPDPEGKYTWMDTRVGPVIEDGAVVAVTLTATDVTTRKLTADALRASEERYRTLVEVLPDAVFINAGGRIKFCNAAFVTMMGATTKDELLGLTPFDIFHPDDHEEIRNRTAIVAAGGTIPSREETVVTLDGKHRRVRVVATTLVDGGEKAYLVVLHDLTERQRTEHLLGSVLESVSDAIVTIDQRGSIVSFNPATRELFGYSASELMGKNVNMLMPEPFRGEHDGYLEAYARTGVRRIIGRGREVTARRRDGSVFPIELSITAFRLDGAQHFTGIIRDITERKKLEDQFRQAHKMEAFGQLAGGVAHDFNNLLTVILSESEYLGEALPRDLQDVDELYVSLSDIHEAGKRAAALTQQLLAFSRKTVLEPKILDVNAIVLETEKMLRRLIGEDISLSAKLAPTLNRVHVDPNQLIQVLVNLAVNARDAMPKGGAIEIETEDVLIDAEDDAGDLAPGQFVKLSFRDTGTGMSREVTERIFQPFFTTKEVGKGTGLGLAVVHGIVTQSGGGIRVHSEVDRGTTFELFLPATTSRRPAKDAERDDALEPREASLLLVEDDDVLRRLATRALVAEGHRVVVARDGREALTILGATSEGFDVVVTDVVMPNLDGRELGEIVRRQFPRTKILYVSGYTDDILVRRGLSSEEVAFLPKPYTPAMLIHAVRRVNARPKG